jgi:hypothetical protein
MEGMHELSGVGGATIMSAIAFSIVFIVLGGLTGIIYGIKYLAAGMDRKKSGGSAAVAAPQAPKAPAGTAGISHFAGTSGTTKGQILAVLAAAVAASGGGRITSISRVQAASSPHGTPWKQMGIVENLSTMTRDWR